MNAIIGIDPGAKGAIFWLVDASKPDGAGAIDMPTVKVKKAGPKLKSGKFPMATRVSPEAVANSLKQIPYPISCALIERVSSQPKDGVASAFVFGKAAGIVEGVCAGLGIPTTLVVPQVWQRAMGVQRDLTGNTKNSSRARASKLFPKHAHLFTLKKHDGRADAALLALYGAVLQ